jgi:hypothetical protein
VKKISKLDITFTYLWVRDVFILKDGKVSFRYTIDIGITSIKKGGSLNV